MLLPQAQPDHIHVRLEDGPEGVTWNVVSIAGTYIGLAASWEAARSLATATVLGLIRTGRHRG